VPTTKDFFFSSQPVNFFSKLKRQGVRESRSQEAKKPRIQEVAIGWRLSGSRMSFPRRISGFALFAGRLLRPPDFSHSWLLEFLTSRIPALQPCMARRYADTVSFVVAAKPLCGFTCGR
jgi:hypothetical protein